MPTACSGWLCQWIYFVDRGAVWLHCYGQETDLPFVKMQEDLAYEFRLTRMSQRPRHSILDRETTQNLIALPADVSCFDYLFLTAWFSTLCNRFQDFLDFEHRFRKMATSSTMFVSWHCVEAFLISIQNCAHFYVLVDCPE